MKSRVPLVRYNCHCTDPKSEAETIDRRPLDEYLVENNRSQIDQNIIFAFNNQVSNIYFSLTSHLSVLQESDDSTLRKSGNRDSADDFTRCHRLDNFAYILFTCKKNCFAQLYLKID